MEERISQWLCGGCGETHGWVCPVYGAPGDKKRVELMTKVEEQVGHKLSVDEARVAVAASQSSQPAKTGA